MSADERAPPGRLARREWSRSLEIGNEELQLAAAGLDVFEMEPAVNPDYLTLINVFLLPHLGSDTIEMRTRMGMICLNNISAVLLGEPAPSLARS